MTKESMLIRFVDLYVPLRDRDIALAALRLVVETLELRKELEARGLSVLEGSPR